MIRYQVDGPASTTLYLSPDGKACWLFAKDAASLSKSRLQPRSSILFGFGSDGLSAQPERPILRVPGSNVMQCKGARPNHSMRTSLFCCFGNRYLSLSPLRSLIPIQHKWGHGGMFKGSKLQKPPSEIMVRKGNSCEQRCLLSMELRCEVMAMCTLVAEIVCNALQQCEKH